MNLFLSHRQTKNRKIFCEIFRFEFTIANYFRFLIIKNLSDRQKTFLIFEFAERNETF